MESQLNYDGLLIPFVVLHILGGWIGLPVIITVCIVSKNVMRHPTLINFWITWVVYSVSFSLLLFAQQRGTTYPNYHPSTICRVQSAMIHGTPAMSAMAGLIVVIQTWIASQDPSKKLKHGQMSKTFRSQLALAAALTLPYVVFVAFGVASAIVGGNNPEKVNGSNGLYCTLNMPTFGQYAVPIFCSVLLMVLIFFEVMMTIRCWNSWRNVSKLFPLAERKTSPSLVLRILLFNLYSIITLSVGIYYASTFHTAISWPYMAQAALPLVAFLVFGMQKDMLRALVFWRQVPSDKSEQFPTWMPELRRVDTKETVTTENEV